MFDFENLRNMAIWNAARQTRNDVNSLAAQVAQDRRERAAERLRQALLPKCPHCGGAIPGRYDVCTHCGRELHWGGDRTHEPFKTSDAARRDREAEIREQEEIRRKEADAQQQARLKQENQLQVRKLQQAEAQRLREAAVRHFGKATADSDELRGWLVTINMGSYFLWQFAYWFLLAMFWIAGFVNLSPQWWVAQTHGVHVSAFAPLVAALYLFVDLSWPLLSFPREEKEWPHHWAKTDPAVFRGTCTVGAVLLGLQAACLGVGFLGSLLATLGVRMKWWSEMSPWVFACVAFGPLLVAAVFTLVMKLFATVALGGTESTVTVTAGTDDSRGRSADPSSEKVYFKRESHIRGPFAIEQAVTILRQGHIKDSDYVSRNAMGPWQPVKEWRISQLKGQ